MQAFHVQSHTQAFHVQHRLNLAYLEREKLGLGMRLGVEGLHGYETGCGRPGYEEAWV